MKKIFIPAVLFFIIITATFSCKKQLEEQFVNPEKVTEANLSGLFTGMLNNDRIVPKYYNVRTFLCQMPGVYAQTSYRSASNTIYQQNDPYSQNYWDDFYTTEGSSKGGAMAMYRSIEATYNSLSASEQANQEIIKQAAKILLIEQAAKMVDMWGDIPYSEAGSLEQTSTIKLPKYDDQKTLYMGFIADLADIATFFLSATTTSTFSKADILLKGNTTQWATFANALRLRLLMRISSTDEATAKPIIMDMLANPSNFPLVDGGNIGSYSPGQTDILLHPLTNSNSSLNAAFTEGSWYATDYMLNTVMLPAADPRIPVIYDKYGKLEGDVFIPNQTYRAMPLTFTEAEESANYREYSVLDSATFLLNIKLPGILMTASEVNFLKAEAYERWGSTAEAKAAYDTALKQSVTFYHYLNNLNTGQGYVNVPMPASSIVEDWVNTSTASYVGSVTNKLSLIYTQKWVHYGVLQSIEAWAEYRRTGFPVLTFPSEGKLPGFSTPPTRLMYPANDWNKNFQNYQAVQAKDTRTTKIFWMP
ncbi:SusD/RagB family nutrient-binding outer membrane lipoprotein [Pedobacter sp. MW01-1-1]|uniref:SusD/RagB family nutrient-binding outer membrane lipoprotein n=1 Tax=Pedobacter sp. MW01-1-1 TaxID=3383027 RepID=UPI003FEF8E3E